MSEPQSEHKDRHVIILGAGASMSSGYPSAEKLRVLLSSPVEIMHAFADSYKLRDSSIIYDANHSALRDRANKVLEEFRNSFRLFREGAFGSVDEFCKLVGTNSGFSAHVHRIRKLLRIAFMVRNPELHFELSDYYPFVQRLYLPTLETLNPKITVLTYNYDPHLDYVLSRSIERRSTIATGTGLSKDQKNSVTSGLNVVNDLDWLGIDQSFAFLKLHGSICYPSLPSRDNSLNFGYTSAFHENPQDIIRFHAAFHEDWDWNIPPVMFPWEFFENGSFVPREKFQNDDDEGNNYLLYKGIWDRARRDVQRAKKISIIGLNVHHFMNDGLKFLFKGMEFHKTNFVFVNDKNPDISMHRAPDYVDVNSVLDYSHSAAARFCRVMRELDLARRFNQVKLINSFRDFIDQEMG